MRPRPQLRTEHKGTRRGLVMLSLLASVLALGGMPVPGHTESVDDLVLITEDYPPLNFEHKGKRQGIAVDLLVEMLALSGSRRTADDIKVWPWARGYETALRDKNTLLFSTTRTEAREKLFKWVGPIVPARNVLVAKKSRHIRIASIADVNKGNYRVGVVREDVAERLLLEMGVNSDKLFQTNSGISIAKMLQADRVDLWAYGSSVILWDLKQLGYATADYEEVFALNESQQYYYAFNKNTDDKLIAQLQAALDKLKANGRFNGIVARYR